MSSLLQQKQLEAHEAAQREENLKVCEQWFAKRRDVKKCMATIKAIDEFCGLSEVSISIEDLDFALSNGMKVVRQTPEQRTANLEERKEDLIDKICALLDPASGGAYRLDAAQLKQERAKLQHYTIPQLENRLQEVQSKNANAAKPLHELREQVREHYAPRYQRPALPAEYTAEKLRDRSFPVFELKKLIRMYGVDVVNDRIFGRS